MNIEEHKLRHEALHLALDELVADFIQHTSNLPSKTPIMDLMKWSNEQRENPIHTEGEYDEDRRH